MCGVFGYVGQTTDVGSAIIDALKTLEYRGYDSWGVAVSTPESILIEKNLGRINGQHPGFPSGSLGFGHTRWATHGGVTQANSHPHLDCSGRLAVIHNGIIENHAGLRASLAARGHMFASATDSEVVSHLVEEQRARGESFDAAVAAAFDQLDGYNAIVVMDHDGQQLAATKRISPLVVGQRDSTATIASDAIALHDHADSLIYLEDDQLAVLSADGVRVLDRGSLRPLTPQRVAFGNIRETVGLNGYPDFLSKEVAEQPDALRRIADESQTQIAALAVEIAASTKTLVVGCGTAGNAALAGTYFFSQICRRDLTFIPAAEFRYRAGRLDSDTLVIAMSQSGETVDVLDAMSEARSHGCRLAAIVNNPNSTLDRSVSTTVHLRAGPEQCVLATKSYTAMLAVLLLTAFQLDGRWDEGADAMRCAADGIERTLSSPQRARIRNLGRSLAENKHLYVIGRGVHFPSALEAALKIKEVSYLHAEGFAAGELKHGVIALIEPGTPCLVIAPRDDTRVDILSGASELKSRGARIIGVGADNDDVFDDFIDIPDAGIANPLVEAVPGQLLGYFAALARGNDPDRPRNLAKSVTVK